MLLAFFPLAFTSTCTAEVCAFSEDYDRFATGDTEVLPTSVEARLGDRRDDAELLRVIASL